MKPKMVYVMNVDWNWIKQRPHFLAEGLSEYFDITMFYQYRYRRKGYQKRAHTECNIKPIYVIPRLDKSKYFNWINKNIKNFLIKRYIRKEQPYYIYLTFPDQIDAIPKKFKGKIIYDCMDNHPAFISDLSIKKRIIEQESRLIERADYIFISSVSLKYKLRVRYGMKFETKINVVRNGFDGKIVDVNDVPTENKKDFIIGYFGTISRWFNFDFVIKSLEKIPNLKYVLIGPVSGVITPMHHRLSYIGTVEHDQLYETVKNCDALIMPFIVNEIIEAVDPVKLYEYINFNKKILCVKYKEIERFSNYVYFYNDFKSFIKSIQEMRTSPVNKYSKEERISFLQNNTWITRVEQICRIILQY